ncbi:MAG: GDSL-type esterase/lipase family protein [Huintestinicola sp.]
MKVTEFKADSNHVRHMGRTLFRNDTLWLGYSLTGVEFDFCGTSLSAELSTDWVNDEEWKHIFQPYMALFVNGRLEKRFAVNEGTAEYKLFCSEKPEKVRIKLVKLSENAFSKVGLSVIFADGEISPTKPISERRIEFIGDSITCGFGIEASCGTDGFCTAEENSCENYAATTARHFGAEFNLVSWTSIGVISNSVKEDVNEPDTGWLMPYIYDYTDLSTDGFLGAEAELWDSARFSPQLIVVNLGTNDKDYTRGVPERVNAFQLGYEDFIRKLREKNPDSVILCTLGVMGQQLCPQVEAAVENLRRSDDRIFSMRFEEQKESDGIGAELHPNMKTHKIMAERLIKEIEKLEIFK